jgi:3alpha(or 20beta)-hydroxysteroid dehydrogenase
MERRVDYVRRAQGRLDVLVNNAGVAQQNGLLDTPIEEWEAVLRTNLTGAFIGIQLAVDLTGRDASIINVSSIAGASGWRPPAYAASKWGSVASLIRRHWNWRSGHPRQSDFPWRR